MCIIMSNYEINLLINKLQRIISDLDLTTYGIADYIKAECEPCVINQLRAYAQINSKQFGDTLLIAVSDLL